MKHNTLTFETPDLKKFRNLALAYEALKMGGNIPCVLNAANEVVVQAFLDKKIGFVQMPEIIEKCIKKADFVSRPNIDDYIETNLETRKLARNIMNNVT